ncbi:MAG TPA: glycosyltransferase family 9 protein [Candidatus Dormibacteraeota bacterium]|jgi:ADP-heptose:LPS heptosyltransferase
MIRDRVRTAILLGGGVREAIMAQPVLRAVPGATILAGPEAVGTLVGLPDMGRRLILDGSPGSWLRAFRRLREGSISRVVLTPPVTVGAAALAYFAGVPHRLMLEGPFDLTATDRIRRVRGLHPVDASHRLAAAAGSGDPPAEPGDAPSLTPTNAVRQRAAERWPDVSGRHGAYLVVVPGHGSWSGRPPARLWGAERFAVVANQSTADRILLLAGQGDAGAVRETRAGIAKPTIVVRLVDVTIEEVAAIGERSLAVIGHDSDALHVAAAAGAPVLALLGPQGTAPRGPRVTSQRVDDFERLLAGQVVAELRRHLRVTSYA